MEETGASPLTPVETLQKRPRPVLSCLECRRKKLKCDRLLPCQQCRKSGRTALCAYSSGTDPDSRANESEDGDREPKRVKKTPVTERQVVQEPERNLELRVVPSRRSGVLEELQDRVARLEEVIGPHCQVPIGPPRDNDEQDRIDGSDINGIMKPISKSTSRYHARGRRMTLLSQARSSFLFASTRRTWDCSSLSA
jgi:Fungal Zn(2)-Cys(6) binuclear cluster domain